VFLGFTLLALHHKFIVADRTQRAKNHSEKGHCRMPCETFSTVVSFITGAGVAFITDRFATRREAKNRERLSTEARDRRKRDFLGILGGMRAEAERIAGDPYAQLFRQRVIELRRESARIESDLTEPMRTAFKGAVVAMCRLTDGQVAEIQRQPEVEYLGRLRVTEAIDNIVEELG